MQGHDHRRRRNDRIHSLVRQRPVAANAADDDVDDIRRSGDGAGADEEFGEIVVGVVEAGGGVAGVGGDFEVEGVPVAFGQCRDAAAIRNHLRDDEEIATKEVGVVFAAQRLVRWIGKERWAQDR